MLRPERDKRGVWAKPDWETAYGGTPPAEPPLDIFFAADRLRRERTGVHGELMIAGAKTGTVFAHDGWANLGKPEDRTRLFNRFWKGVEQALQAVLPELHLRHDFDEFCRLAWGTWIETDAGTFITPPDTVPPVVYALQPYIKRGGGTIMHGLPASGKTWLALLMAVSVDAGLSRLWRTQQARAFVINLERSAETAARRLWCVNAALGLPTNRPLLMLNRRGRSMDDVWDAAYATVQRERVGVVFLDSISRGGYGPLTKDETANAAVDGMSALSDTWCAIGHSPKSDPTTMYGNTMFAAGADIMLLVRAARRANELGVVLEMYEAKDVPWVPRQVFRLTFDEVLGLRAISRSTIEEWPELARGGAEGTVHERIASALQAHAMTVEELAEEAGASPATVRKELHRHDGFVKLPDGRWGLKASEQSA